MKRTLVPALLFPMLLAAAVAGVRADGPGDNIPEKVRPVPPPGIEVPAADRAELQAGLDSLKGEIESLRGDSRARAFLPDVEIYHKAVRYSLQYGEFFNPREIQTAKQLLEKGHERAKLLAQGQTPWVTTPGPSARGYLSDVDGSVQPYGLYVPDSYKPDSGKKYRLDTWFHGRGENLSEVNFIAGVERGGGPFVRPDTFTLQPYGRYCCANKLAGETDLFEGIRAVQKEYPIDRDRIVQRGFSMGGAACWQVAAHYAGDWAAAAPGAGFSETPEFLRVYQSETLKPTWYEVKLWRMYDCPYYVDNFFNIPTVAYNGTIDSQKQAADVMDRAFEGAGMKLIRVFGPNTGHAYHPSSIPVINAMVDDWAAKGRNPVPKHVKLQTPTLKYNRQLWVTADALREQWEVAKIDAQIVDPAHVELKTQNVTALSLEMPAGLCPLEGAPQVAIDTQRVTGPKLGGDRSWTAHFRRENGRWKAVKAVGDGKLAKRHDLQGPIDDAFTESFVIVRPTGTPQNPSVAKWVDAEMAHAVTEWRRQFHGDARVKDDTAVTDADMRDHNLALWGDPGSNKVLARVAGKLPIRWTKDAVLVGGRSYPAGTHAPILIYPNPLNPKRYVVVNSGFTYREYDYLNNARQVPKLPDWAIVDTTTPPNSRYPGKIVDADFFGERWELRPPHHE